MQCPLRFHASDSPCGYAMHAVFLHMTGTVVCCGISAATLERGRVPARRVFSSVPAASSSTRFLTRPRSHRHLQVEQVPISPPEYARKSQCKPITGTAACVCRNDWCAGCCTPGVACPAPRLGREVQTRAERQSSKESRDFRNIFLC